MQHPLQWLKPLKKLEIAVAGTHGASNRTNDSASEPPAQDEPSWMCFVTAAVCVCVCLLKGHAVWGLTCHYGAHQEEDAEEDVACQCAEVVHDLPLADGEENPKDLRRWRRSEAELGARTHAEPPPHLRRTVEEARGGPLRLRVGQLHRKLEAERQVARHEEPGQQRRIRSQLDGKSSWTPS